MKEFKELPPRLQRLALVWAEPENWGKKLVDICKQEGLNYNTIRKDITVFGSYDFYEIKAQLVLKNLSRIYDVAAKALAKKVEQGHPKALEMFWKLKKELGDRVEVSGSIDLNIQKSVENAFNRVQELEEDEK